MGSTSPNIWVCSADIMQGLRVTSLWISSLLFPYTVRGRLICFIVYETALIRKPCFSWFLGCAFPPSFFLGGGVAVVSLWFLYAFPMVSLVFLWVSLRREGTGNTHAHQATLLAGWRSASRLNAFGGCGSVLEGSARISGFTVFGAFCLDVRTLTFCH